MRKKILCLIMTAVMVAGAAMTVSAEDLGWQVTFNGSDMVSNFDSEDIADQMDDVQPGDTVELEVTVKNTDSGSTDWYMSTEVMKTLEYGSDAEGGAYSYSLVYTGSDGTESVLYEKGTVGGEDTENGEGLEQIEGTLEDYFYMGRLASGESGKVVLTIVVDGETQGNDYQDTLARLDLNFAVEKVVVGQTYTTVTRQTVTTTGGSNPKTGDTTNLLIYCAIILAGGLFLLWAGLYSMKRKKNNEDEKGA